eukprot:jgi/Picsp_1/4482/NSC_06703-R1_3 5 -cyclic nucleotide phosphodiesterase family protein
MQNKPNRMLVASALSEAPSERKDSNRWIRSSIDILVYSFILATLLLPKLYIILNLQPIYDKYLNGGLIFCVVFFLGEIVISDIPKKNVRNIVLDNLLDYVGIATIVLDLTWIAERTSMSTSENKMLIDFWQALSLLKLLRLLRATTIFVNFARLLVDCFVTKSKTIDNRRRQDQIGTKLADILVAQAIVMVILFAMAMRLLLAWDYSVSPFTAMTHGISNSFNPSTSSSQEKDSLAMSVPIFSQKYLPNDKPLYLESGNWSVAFVNAGDYPNRHWSLKTYRSFSNRGGALHNTILSVDISDRNAHNALVELIIMLVIIVQIALFSVALHMLLYQSIVKPLRRIYEAIKSHASVVVRSLDKTADTQCQGISSYEMDTRDADMTAMEVAINKILKFMSNSVDLGGKNEVLYQLASGADAETLAWISNMTGVRTLTHKEQTETEMQEPTESFDKLASHVPSITPGSRVGGSDSTLIGLQRDTHKIQSWSFNLFEYAQSICSNAINNDPRDRKDVLDDNLFYSKSQEVLQELIVTMFKQLNLIDCSASNKHSIDCKPVTSERTLRRFLAIICKSYNNKNPYHNFYHYKEADVFENLDHDSWIQVRKLIIEAIMHTDMIHHFPMMSKLEVMIQLHADNDQEIKKSCFGQSQEDRLLLLSMILHAADISNPVRPINIASKWANMVTREFFAQGDLEKSKGYPVSPMCDRQGTFLPETQVKFIEFIVAPYYNLMEKIFPEFACLTQRIEQNKQYWKSKCNAF